MKSYRKELWFEVPTRRAFINITPQVEDCIRESGIQEGLCLVAAMHITASVFINDDVVADIQPQARAFSGRLGGDKGVEDCRLQLFGNTRTGVSNPNLRYPFSVTRGDHYFSLVQLAGHVVQFGADQGQRLPFRFETRDNGL